MMLRIVPHDTLPVDPESRQFPPSCLPGIEATAVGELHQVIPSLVSWLVGDEAVISLLRSLFKVQPT